MMMSEEFDINLVDYAIKTLEMQTDNISPDTEVILNGLQLNDLTETNDYEPGTIYAASVANGIREMAAEIAQDDDEQCI